MTNEQAKSIFLLEYCSQRCGTQYRRHCDNCEINLAMKALEKQIPKKVEWTEDYTWGKKTDQPVCPVCDYYLTMHHFIGGSKKISYCDSCGQAIAWEE